MPEPAVPGRFARYELRTTDPAGARAFYAEILGAALDHPSLEIGSLPEPARVRGAPPHWLGHLAVADVASAVEALRTAGAQRLGPPVPTGPGGRIVLRDPFGAVLAVAPREPVESGGPPGPVRWHALAVEDAERALRIYAATFGWTRTGALSPDGTGSSTWGFAWGTGGTTVGSVSDHARLPGVHPHWLFLFGVSDVERSASGVRALGGTVLPTVRASGGGLAVMCEDPRGAAFGLLGPTTVPTEES